MLARSAIAAMAPAPSNSGTAGGAEGGAFGVMMKYPAWACSIIAKQNKNAFAPIVSFLLMDVPYAAPQLAPHMRLRAGPHQSMIDRCLGR